MPNKRERREQLLQRRYGPDYHLRRRPRQEDRDEDFRKIWAEVLRLDLLKTLKPAPSVLAEAQRLGLEIPKIHLDSHPT